MNLSPQELNRYSRHLLMEEFGQEAQLKLKAARVLVVGAGGLGSPCLLYLAAAGVGHIGIADDDVLHESNLQRQVLFNTEDIGFSKAGRAKVHLLKQNSFIEIETHPRITPENVFEVLKLYDLVIDGSDNFSTRYLLNDACVIGGKPYIYGALFKFEGQVSTFNYMGGPTYRCLYPEAPAAGQVPACGEAGVLGVLPGIIGTWQATEALKIITGVGEPLSGKLLVIDLLSNEINSIGFKAVPDNKKIASLETYDDACSISNQSVDYSTLNKWIESGEVTVVDVREEYEYERFNIGGLNVPLSSLEEEIDEFNTGNKVVVLCQTGARSLKAMQIVQRTFPDLEIYNLKNGIQSII